MGLGRILRMLDMDFDDDRGRRRDGRWDDDDDRYEPLHDDPRDRGTYRRAPRRRERDGMLDELFD